jgi:hypothetical protein
MDQCHFFGSKEVFDIACKLDTHSTTANNSNPPTLLNSLLLALELSTSFTAFIA